MGRKFPIHSEFGGERVLAIISPGCLFRLDWLKFKVGQVFPRLDCLAPRDLDHLADAVKRSVKTHRVVMAVGGDGTLHRVINSADLAEQVIALLPMGTGNDLARSLAVPNSVDSALKWLAGTRSKPTDLVSICGILAHNSAGFGLDTATLHVRDSRRGLAHSNYNVAFLIALRELKPLRLKITWEGGGITGEYLWVLGMNSRFIGKGTMIAPDASLDDGLLDVVLIEKTPPLKLLAMMPSVIQGKHDRLKPLRHLKSSVLVCESEQPVDYIAADGELYYVLERRIEIRSLPGAMRMLR
jgi:diacylglycerol kinase (ATP)